MLLDIHHSKILLTFALAAEEVDHVVVEAEMNCSGHCNHRESLVCNASPAALEEGVTTRVDQHARSWKSSHSWEGPAVGYFQTRSK